MNTIKIHPHLWILALAALLCTVHFCYFHGGYFGYDEIEYGRLASFLLDGRFQHENLYAFRYLGYLPLAVSYFIFGIGDFANWLVPTLTLLGVCGILLRFISNHAFLTKLLVVVMVVCVPIHLMYLERPMPDVTTELGFLLCFYAYHKVRYKDHLLSGWKFPMIFLIGFVFIFLSKETFVILYPFFLVLWIIEIWKNQRREFWWKAGGGIAVFMIGYLALNAIFLGDPFARVEAIYTNRYITTCTYEFQPASVIIKRIMYELWLDFIRQGLLLPLGLALVLLFKKGVDEKLKFWTYSWVWLLLLSNFMTISYTDYVPLCNDPRHFMFVIPIGAMVWAGAWDQANKFTWLEMGLIVTIWAGQCLVSVHHGFELKGWLYGPLILGFILVCQTRWKVIGSVIALMGILSGYVWSAQYNQIVNHKDQKELITHLLTLNENLKWIITDAANTNIGNYYANYNDEVTFVEFKKFDPQIHLDRESYIISNGMTAYLSNTDWSKVPQPIIHALETLPVFYENRAGKVYRFANEQLGNQTEE